MSSESRAARWMLAIQAIGLAGLLLLVLGWWLGSRLPETHVAASRARYEVAPARLWELLSEVEARPGWRQGVESSRVLSASAELPTWIETTGWGELRMETRARDPERLLVVHMADPEGQFSGTWSYHLQPAGGGTTLTIVERGRIHYGLDRALSRYLMGYHGTMDAELGDLGRHLGLTVEPVHLAPEDIPEDRR